MQSFFFFLECLIYLFSREMSLTVKKLLQHFSCNWAKSSQHSEMNEQLMVLLKVTPCASEGAFFSI